jgi:hypothetical protein
MQSMFCYRKAAVERAMKVQEVILRAMAKKITWWHVQIEIPVPIESQHLLHQGQRNPFRRGLALPPVEQSGIDRSGRAQESLLSGNAPVLVTIICDL